MSTPFDDLVASAACPGDPDGLALLESCAAQAWRQSLRVFLERAAPGIALPAGAERVLRDMAEAEPDFERLWHPSLGALVQAGRQPRAGFLLACALEIAWHAHQSGVAGEWRAHWNPPRTLVLPDRIVDVRALRVVADGRRLSLSAAGADGARLALSIESRSWGGADRSPTLAAYPARTPDDREQPVGEPDAAAAQALAAGLALLDQGAPVYGPWVRRLVRLVRPLRRSGGQVSSWSSLHYPGLVSMTLFASPLDMAETLVHEASHQHFHLADRLFPLVERGVEEWLYSPVKRCRRPAVMVLLAYHAFGNVALFFDALRRNGRLAEADWRHHMADLQDWLPRMAAELERAHSLSPAGRRFLCALQRRLQTLTAPEENLSEEIAR
ncbi:aKG-HExxH-type peptide beta-hydroxylase [Chromobacterium rhizoryzae]|uniref:HEXXH motif domain-containing protein n=1 Tax=Chromobacterium rhizoryzae TaxID=1778675 RepID=A0AAD0W734_9NEIS|nr:HEXXH motif-containing putative peptide modification protein [Chromobacterium rhizoryzae]AXT45804.1 hypothetical protein D1345_06245 [Chromobacterium rhizoryzae]